MAFGTAQDSRHDSRKQGTHCEDARYLRGKACIAGHRIRVMDIVMLHEQAECRLMRSWTQFPRIALR